MRRRRFEWATVWYRRGLPQADYGNDLCASVRPVEPQLQLPRALAALKYAYDLEHEESILTRQKKRLPAGPTFVHVDARFSAPPRVRRYLPVTT